MKLPNLLPKWIRGKSADPEGSTPVSNLAADPEGAAPKGLIFKIGVVLLAVLMAVVILLAPDDPGGNAQAPVAPALPPPAGPEAVTKGEREIQDAEERRRLEASRAARAQQQAQQQAQRDSQERARQIQEEWQRQQEAQAGANAGVVGSAAGQQELTPEQQLQMNIRLEKIQRRHNSLRAAPVALSFRAAAPAAPAVPQVEVTPPPVRPQPQVRPQPSAPAAAAAEEPEPAPPAEQALVESGVIAAQRQGQAPRGWERIDGGQWLEAVLITQIRGDSPGPAIALVSTPFWSRDRQRILIPRGARFIGRAQAVNNLDQARLTVTFDRLIFEGHDLRLPFAGLSQAGEAGLKDQVKRHYLATFGAAGAVGVLSGLTLRNTQSYGFGQPAGQAARMEAGRSLGESASAIMSRFLNRLPTITIRAGHRIRIYFTSDLLVPRRPS